jgi:hypothetical protein
MIKQTIDLCNKFNDKEDIEHFTKEYEKLGFIHPERIQYENYYYGKCKDILFGSDLNEYCHDHPSRTVPLIVSKSIDQIEKLGGIEREGIYRVSARQSVVDNLRVEFEKDEECVDLDARFDVFTVASVLKVYFRELKQPLFNFSMNDRMNYSSKYFFWRERKVKVSLYLYFI